jgi:hypothetical protein
MPIASPDNGHVKTKTCPSSNKTGIASNQGCTNPGFQVTQATKFLQWWILSMECPSCQHSGILNFEIAPKYFGQFFYTCY